MRGRAGRARSRAGVSLAELVVVLAIGGVLGVVLLTTFAGAQRLTRLQGERVALAEARRVAASILAAEVRYLAPGADLHFLARDSIVLRAFRGSAVVCLNEGGTVLVRYRGIRAPEPAKDSVVWVGGGEMWDGGDVVGASGGGFGGVSGGGTGTGRHPASSALHASTAVSAGCALREGEYLYRWALNPAPVPGTLLLLFESGSYHLNGNALRYRRGESGRQPLTAELFDDRGVGMHWIVPAGGGSQSTWYGAAEEMAGVGAIGDASAAAGIELVLVTRQPRPGTDPGGGPSMRYWLGLRNGGRW